MAKPKVLGIRERIAVIAAQSAPSMVPVPSERPLPPPEKEEELIPPISDLIEDNKMRLKLAQLVDQHGQISEMLKPYNKEKKLLTDKIKVFTGKFGIGKAISGEWRINYYNAPRETLDESLLLAAGVSIDTIKACKVKKDSFTLRITKEGADDADE